MPDFRPFRGIRYNPGAAGSLSDVVAPPYDVLSTEEIRELYRRSPHNVIRLDLGVLDEEGGFRDDWHGHAGALLVAWLEQGVLRRDGAPAYYVLRQRYTLPGTGEKSLVGLVGMCRLEPFESGKVLPHEHTFSKPKEDRLRLMRATKANLSQIYAFYSDPGRKVDALLEQVTAAPAAHSARDRDGHLHEVWVLDEPQLQAAVYEALKDQPAYIADGHHRYETALAFREEMQAREGERPDAGWNFVMMFLVNLDAGGLTVLPTHRLLRPPAPAPEALAEALSGYYRLEERRLSREEALALARETVTEGSGRLACYFGGGRWLWLEPLEPGRIAAEMPRELSEPVRALTVTALHELVLAKGFGIGREEQHRGGVIEYLRDAEVGVAEVDAGRAGALVYVPAPTPQHIRAVAEARDVMPHKSTYFHPKLLTGLVLADLSEPVPQVAGAP